MRVFDGQHVSSAVPMVLPELKQQEEQQRRQEMIGGRRRRRVLWVTRVQGRRELSAACTAARREGATMFVRLTRTDCRPCAASEPVVRAALAAVGDGGEQQEENKKEQEEDPPAANDADRTAGPQLRVFWLNADDPGSADAMAFFTSRRLCRGVPAHFLWRGSQDLHMPDLALDGAEPVALARLLARAGADGGPTDLSEFGAMEGKNAGADTVRLRREGDRGSLAVLDAVEMSLMPPVVVLTPPPPHNQQYNLLHQQLHQSPQYYYPPPPPPSPIQRHLQTRPGAMHFTW